MLKPPNKQENRLLEKILKELKTIRKQNIQPDSKEWFPLTFSFYVKGQTGTTKVGTVWIYKDVFPIDKILKYDFSYEFYSLDLTTRNRNYNPSIRLIINGNRYPQNHRFASSDENSPWYNNAIFQGHNYDYQREYSFFKTAHYQSNWGSSHYDFKMVVNPNWTLNFEYYCTTTSWYFHFLMINGWKLHFNVVDDKKESRVVLLMKKDTKNTILKF